MRLDTRSPFPTSLASLVALLMLAGFVLGGATGAAFAEPASPQPAVAMASASSPVPVIEAFHAGLLQIMKDAKTLGFQGRTEKLAPLMAKTFDLDFMASKTVGRHWSTLSAADKKRWAETFTRFTTANYAGRFTGYTGEQFVTLGVENAARDTRLVRTQIVVPNDETVELNYRVMQRGGQWRVIDVYLNGKVSELALRRSEYASALKRDGFDGLVDSVETKIADLKKKGLSEG
ncbi:ABC transporter substrate-binding protein [Myxococcota bacterium]|nr:ABC transporter substrate-binding protein [Myxococcota bacterium]